MSKMERARQLSKEIEVDLKSANIEIVEINVHRPKTSGGQRGGPQITVHILIPPDESGKQPPTLVTARKVKDCFTASHSRVPIISFVPVHSAESLAPN
jgi:hypothetical protein